MLWAGSVWNVPISFWEHWWCPNIRHTHELAYQFGRDRWAGELVVRSSCCKIFHRNSGNDANIVWIIYSIRLWTVIVMNAFTLRLVMLNSRLQPLHFDVILSGVQTPPPPGSLFALTADEVSLAWTFSCNSDTCSLLTLNWIPSSSSVVWASDHWRLTFSMSCLTRSCFYLRKVITSFLIILATATLIQKREWIARKQLPFLSIFLPFLPPWAALFAVEAYWFVPYMWLLSSVDLSATRVQLPALLRHGQLVHRRLVPAWTASVTFPAMQTYWPFPKHICDRKNTVNYWLTWELESGKGDLVKQYVFLSL